MNKTKDRSLNRLFGINVDIDLDYVDFFDSKEGFAFESKYYIVSLSGGADIYLKSNGSYVFVACSNAATGLEDGVFEAKLEEILLLAGYSFNFDIKWVDTIDSPAHKTILNNTVFTEVQKVLAGHRKCVETGEEKPVYREKKTNVVEFPKKKEVVVGAPRPEQEPKVVSIPTTTEEEIIEKKEVRAEFMKREELGRFEILDRVGNLLTLPEDMGAPTSVVAEFYGVAKTVIANYFDPNSDVGKLYFEELYSDGFKTMKGKEILSELETSALKINVENVRGGVLVDGIRLAYTNNTIISKRGILRLGMILRNSEIAKEIRTQLLNVIAKVDDKTKTEDISEEKKLLLDIMMADDEIELAVATKAYRQFKDRHVNNLQKELDFVVENNITFDDFYKVMNATMRLIAKETNNAHQYIWNTFYEYLDVAHGIRVATRQGNEIRRHNNERALSGKTKLSKEQSKSKFPKVRMIKQEEYENVLRIAKAWAADQGVAQQLIETVNRLTV